MKVAKNLLIILLVLFGSYLLGKVFSDLYLSIFPGSGGSFIDVSSLIGLPLAYTFFLTLLFTIFGDKKKYWWIGILLIPAALFEIYFDFIHLYFPIGIGLVGWLLGWLILKLFKRR